MTDAVLRIGLVGYGFGGRYFHAPLIVREDGNKKHKPDEAISVRPQKGMIYRFDKDGKPLARA